MKKWLLPKILAFVALFSIVIWIVGTWILFIMSSSNTPTTQTQTLSEAQLDDLIKKYETLSWSIEVGSGEVDEIIWEILTNTWETEIETVEIK